MLDLGLCEFYLEKSLEMEMKKTWTLRRRNVLDLIHISDTILDHPKNFTFKTPFGENVDVVTVEKEKNCGE